MPDVLDDLLRDHEGTRQVLDVLEREARAFDAGERPDYDILSAAAEYLRQFPDRYHHPRENLVFLRLRQRDPAAVEGIGDLVVAHHSLTDQLHLFTAGLRALLNDMELPRESFADWIHGFIDAQREHIQMEEERFFPAAERLLTPADWQAVVTGIAYVAAPAPGAAFDRRLEALRQAIIASSGSV
jgi:hemerythrin-like domain-containing protein